MYDWKTWLKGLFSAFIGAVANGVTLMIVDPTNFNLQEGWKKLLSICLVSGLVSVAMYLKQSPLPTEVSTTTTTTSKTTSMGTEVKE